MDEAPKTDQPVTAGPGGDVETAKGTAWLSYLFILWLIPLLTLKDNAFAKFHVKQGIMLTLCWIAVSIAGTIIPILGWFLIAPVGWAILLVLAIMGIVKALNGEYWKLPLGVGNLAEQWFRF